MPGFPSSLTDAIPEMSRSAGTLLSKGVQQMLAGLVLFIGGTVCGQGWARLLGILPPECLIFPPGSNSSRSNAGRNPFKVERSVLA